ncbi:MAG: hypothetical protein EOP38_17775 [Rubrivivax sp.]|nr:MAG: hypothetical protein EOP38_17775 [Rubrivivax sp.]
MNTFQNMCCALAAAVLCGQAVASSAEAKISNIQWTVIDLTPDDGVVPTFDFQGAAGRTTGYVDNYYPYKEQLAGSEAFFWPMTLGNPNGISHGFAKLSATELRADAAHVGGNGGWSTDVWTTTYTGEPISQLTVAPHSAVHLTANGSLTVTRTNGDYVFSTFEARYYTTTVGEGYYSTESEGAIIQTLRTPGDDLSDTQMSQTNQIDFLITNSSAQAMPVSFGFRTSSAVITAVPEPRTIALLLVGLAIVAGPRLRRVHHAQA